VLQAGKLYKKWVEAAGATVTGTGMVFVSPLVSYAGEGLSALRGATLHTPCVVRTGPTTGPTFSAAAPLPGGVHVYEVNNGTAPPPSPRKALTIPDSMVRAVPGLEPPRGVAAA
jgi:hypothetical protein